MMKICFLTYNFPRDYALAAALHENLRAVYQDAAFIWIVEAKDAGVPVPARTRVLVRNFNRGGNLRYTECLHGMTAVYRELADEFDIIVKIDADTFLAEPCAWTDYIADGGDVAYIPHLQNRACGNGCAYALSARAARYFSQISPAEFDARAHQFGGREDMFFTGNAIGNPMFYAAMIPRNRVSWCDINEQPRKAIAAHLGYLSEKDIETRMRDILAAPFAAIDSRQYSQTLKKYFAENGIELPARNVAFDLHGNRINTKDS